MKRIIISGLAALALISGAPVAQANAAGELSLTSWSPMGR